MELTWKDKLSFYLAEVRRKLPFSQEPKKQTLFLGAFSTVIVVLFFSFVLTPVLFPSLISSMTASLSSSTSSSSSSSVRSQMTANSGTSSGASGASGSSGQHNGGNSGASGSYTTQTIQGKPSMQSQGSSSQGSTGGAVSGSVGTSASGVNAANYPPGTVSGISQVVLASSPTPTPNPQQAVIGTSNLPTIAPPVFSGTGTPQPYATPTGPAGSLTWLIYFNSHDLYSIAYPEGWQAIKSIYNNHEGVSLYPPNEQAMLSQVGLQQIGFGISQFSYGMPGVTTDNASSITDIMVDGYSGKLYTQGSLQSDTIAAVFKYGNNYFGIGGTTNSNLMIYVFNYMLSTLTFYGGSYN